MRPATAVLCAECRCAVEHLGGAPVALAGLDVWAAVAYEGPARALVSRLKFHGARALAGHMAAAIAATAPVGFLDRPLVPVPTPRARRRLRGFCHATLLVEALAPRARLPLAGVLERAGSGQRQVGRPRAQRLRAPPAFRAAAGAGAVILVDDVVTTGATLGACRRALEVAGWSCTRAVAYARTPVR